MLDLHFLLAQAQNDPSWTGLADKYGMAGFLITVIAVSGVPTIRWIVQYLTRVWRKEQELDRQAHALVEKERTKAMTDGLATIGSQLEEVVREIHTEAAEDRRLYRESVDFLNRSVEQNTLVLRKLGPFSVVANGDGGVAVEAPREGAHR